MGSSAVHRSGQLLSIEVAAALPNLIQNSLLRLPFEKRRASDASRLMERSLDVSNPFLPDSVTYAEMDAPIAVSAKGRRGARQRNGERSQRDGMVGAARELRKNPTEAEKVLWEALRRKQAEGMRFRRQRVIGPYIVDFCCLGRKLIVEVVGANHYEAEGLAYDADRTAYLKGYGFRVLRFENAAVLNDVDGVVAAIVSGRGIEP